MKTNVNAVVVLKLDGVPWFYRRGGKFTREYPEADQLPVGEAKRIAKQEKAEAVINYGLETQETI